MQRIPDRNIGFMQMILCPEYISKRKFVFNLDLSVMKGDLGNEWVRVSLRSDHQFGNGSFSKSVDQF